jgi:hypothetical protein
MMHQSYKNAMLAAMKVHEFPPFPHEKVIGVSLFLDNGSVLLIDKNLLGQRETSNHRASTGMQCP